MRIHIPALTNTTKHQNASLGPPSLAATALPPVRPWRLYYLIRLLCVAGCVGSLIPGLAAAGKGLQPMDVFDVQQATTPSISPDAKVVAYTRVRRDVMTDTKVTSIELTRDMATWSELADSTGCSRIIWSRDSKRFALLCNRGGHGVLEVRQLDEPGKVVLEETSEMMLDAAWSPDGTIVAFERFVSQSETGWNLPTPPPGAHWAQPFRPPVERARFRVDGHGDLNRGSFETFVVAADGSSPPRQLTSGNWWTGFDLGPDLAWSKDGSEVFIAANRADDWDVHARDRRIFAVNARDGAVRDVVDQPGPNGRPVVSPDGRWLAYTGVEERGLSVENRKIYVIPMTGATRQSEMVARDLDRSIDQFYWLPDSKGFVVTYEDAGTRILAKLSLDGKATELARGLGGDTLELPFTFGSFSAASDGTTSFLLSSSTVPSDVAIKRPNAAIRTIAHLDEELKQRVGGFTPAEPFWVTASTDGERIQAWIMRAPGDNQRTPLILDIHGGPYAQYGDRFSLKYQLYISAGYSVLFANPRGSTGYGERFANLAHNQWPGHDGDDLLDVLNVAAARSFVDPKALFVTGTSGGGTMTLWSVGHSDRFCAAVASKPLTDWIDWTLTSDIGAEVYSHWLGGAVPWKDISTYWSRSVLSLAGQIHSPVMLISGDQDLRAPAPQAVEMFTALKIAGVETALVRGPEVSHNSVEYRPSMFLQEVGYTLGWFEKHRSSPRCRG